MKWDNSLNFNEWNAEISNKEQKIKIAKELAQNVSDGQTIGFGSGSTSFLTAREIAKVVNEKGYKIKAIPTSHEIKLLCESLGIPTTTLMEEKPDWCFDGTDEVNKEGWLIKGRGAAMFKEKLNIINSKRAYILADNSKFVNNLGDNFPIPVECFPDSLNFVASKLKELGSCSYVMRTGKGKDGPIITENGNVILDVKFKTIDKDLEKKLKLIPGVIETGLFINYDNIEIINA